MEFNGCFPALHFYKQFKMAHQSNKLMAKISRVFFFNKNNNDSIVYQKYQVKNEASSMQYIFLIIKSNMNNFILVRINSAFH